MKSHPRFQSRKTEKTNLLGFYKRNRKRHAKSGIHGHWVVHDVNPIALTVCGTDGSRSIGHTLSAVIVNGNGIGGSVMRRNAKEKMWRERGQELSIQSQYTCTPCGKGSHTSLSSGLADRVANMLLKEALVGVSGSSGVECIQQRKPSSKIIAADALTCS